MKITRTSQLTGTEHTLEIPITEEELIAWQKSGIYIQNFFPNLSAEHREFILTGTTAKEWEDAFDPPTDHELLDNGEDGLGDIPWPADHSY